MAHPHHCSFNCNWDAYYASQRQAGGALRVYEGTPVHHIGGGIWSTFLNRIAIPLGQYAIPKIVSGARSWFEDVALHNKNPKEALKSRLIDTAHQMTSDGFDHLKRKVAQSGSGLRRRRITQKRRKRTKNSPQVTQPQRRRRKRASKPKKSVKRRRKSTKSKSKRKSSSKTTRRRRRRSSIFPSPLQGADIFG